MTKLTDAEERRWQALVRYAHLEEARRAEAKRRRVPIFVWVLLFLLAAIAAQVLFFEFYLGAPGIFR